MERAIADGTLVSKIVGGREYLGYNYADEKHISGTSNRVEVKKDAK